MSGSNVNYSFSMDDDLWPVEADEGQINQVMHNIVLNAGDAMPEGGTVAISARNVFIDEKKGEAFDAVILDLTVRGGMGGKETIAKLFETDPDVSPILSIGYSDDPIVANYRDFSFKGVLSKPYEIEKLSSELYSLIYTERMQ